MPEEIQENLIQDVPVVDATTQNVVQQPEPENPVYKFMKANKLTTLSQKDFLQKYSTPEKAKEIHTFMVANNLTTLKDNDFYGKYFPAASTITVTDAAGLKKKVSASSDPGLQNLLAFAKSGKNISKPTSAQVTQPVYSDENQILTTPNLVVPTNTREAVLAKRQNDWDKLVEDASIDAVEKTVVKNGKQGVSYSREQIQGMVDDYKKKVKSGELIIAQNPITGKDALAIPDYNPFSSFLNTYEKAIGQGYEDAYFEGLSPEEKIKHRELQQFVAQDDDSIPKIPAGIFGNLGGFGGQVVHMLEKPTIFSIGLASGAGATEAAALGSTALSTAGGLSSVGNTLGFMSDMANGSYSPTWDKVYYGNLQGIENPTPQQKIDASIKATEAANYSKSIGGAEGLLFGLPFGSFSKSLESSSKGFIDNLLANGKNAIKHAPQMVGTSIAGQIGKGEVAKKYGSGETQSQIIKEGLDTGIETAKFLATMSGLGVVKSAVPYAFTLLTNTKESPSKSLTAKAKAVVSNFPDEVISDVYNQAEQNGVIEPGKANEILNDIQKYRKAEASVPSTVTNTDAKDAIAGKIEKLTKLDEELKATKVNARKAEIEKEKVEINKEIDNIYNGDDVLANEKDIAGNPLKERSEVGKTPILEEEAIIKETPKTEVKPTEVKAEVKTELAPVEEGRTPQVKPLSEFKVGDKFVFATDRDGTERTVVSIDNGIVTYKSKGSKELSSASEIQRLGNDLALLKSDWDKGIRPNEIEFEGSRFKSRIKPTEQQISNLTKELLRVNYMDADLGVKSKGTPGKPGYVESAEEMYRDIAKRYLENDIDIVKTIDILHGGKERLESIINVGAPEKTYQEALKGKQKPFKSSQGNTVELENGKLVVKSKSGEVLSDRASKKAIEEYAENFDYSKGDKAPDVPSEITNSRDAARYVIEESKNPAEIAEIYASEDLLPKESNPKFQAIAEYGLGRIKTSSYKNLGDPNKIEKSMYLKIFSEESGTPIDVLAKSISDKYEGLNIEPQDIVDYIEKYSRGDKSALEFKESDVALQAADKFNKLTGLDLNSELANKIIDNKLGKANKDQLEIIKEDYETAKQLEDAYWAEYKKTDGFTKESNIGEVDRPEAAQKPEKSLEKAYKDLTNIEKRQIINSKFDKLLEELKIEKICPTD